jgi:predicted nucleic acid-binding protein
MKLIITDSSVFFDIIKIQALPEFFVLDLEIRTTDFVKGEILESEQKEQIEMFIRSHQLIVFELRGQEIEEIENFKTKRFFKTLIDKTVLWKAKQLKCPLLTGDAKLRSEAIEQGVTVHGSLWVIQIMVETKVITANAGIEFLEKLKISNDRLPLDEIEKLIKQLKTIK